MRLEGEISSLEEDEEEVKTVASLAHVIVGYALTSKKKKSFLQPKLEVVARNKGILFIAIDQNKPLSDQGPFDVVLHKLSGKDWCEAIEDYRQKNPDVTILDPPSAIRHLHNRHSMLQEVASINLSDLHGKVCIPRQMVIDKDPLCISQEVSKAGLRLPLVAKPLVVDGTAKSHQLFLAYDQYSLSELEPPLVLQEFVNHGGVLFKIYIVGESIKVVRRFSLPNVSNCEIAKVAGVFRFPRVSSAAASADDADLDPSIAELPPRPLLERLSRELRSRLGLQLFNIDMIREDGAKDVYYVIDINYFPGKCMVLVETSEKHRKFELLMVNDALDVILKDYSTINVYPLVFNDKYAINFNHLSDVVAVAEEHFLSYNVVMEVCNSFQGMEKCRITSTFSLIFY